MATIGFDGSSLRKYSHGLVTWLTVLFLMVGIPSVWAEDADMAHGETPGVNEPVGNWKFRTDKPVKVVVIGGSVSAYTGGNFGDFLGNVCRNVEIVNRGKARYGAWALKQRFVAQVLKNRGIKLTDKAIQHWVIFQGGLNSVGTPEKTNKDLRELFVTAYNAGVRVVGLSLSPWGAEADKKRWSKTAGLKYKQYTQKVVDYVMGRLTPADAFGTYVERDRSLGWAEGELPTIAVDLYASGLRDKDAPLRNEKTVEKWVEQDTEIKKRLKSLPADEAVKEKQRIVDELRRIPQWFLRREYHAFDHIHPNREGHRIIAQTLCPKLPADWGCDCEALGTVNPLR
ncbi:MAG: SGNH/GDSL hydrolase family protein [Myxococcales bacterium]|nr:SGNH/GDSL hydrolase family protein [Myxococcales bacterium]